MGDFDLWKAVGVVTEKVGEMVRELTPSSPSPNAAAQVCCLCGATGHVMKFPRGLACLTCLGTAFHGLVARVRRDGEQIRVLLADQELSKSLLEKLGQDFQVLETRVATLTAEHDNFQVLESRVATLSAELDKAQQTTRAASARADFLEAQRSIVVLPSVLEAQRILAAQLAEECYAYFRMNRPPDGGPSKWSDLGQHMRDICTETLMPIAERLLVYERRLRAAAEDGGLDEIENSHHVTKSAREHLSRIWMDARDSKLKDAIRSVIVFGVRESHINPERLRGTIRELLDRMSIPGHPVQIFSWLQARSPFVTSDHPCGQSIMYTLHLELLSQDHVWHQSQKRGSTPRPPMWSVP